jgi:exosortase
VLIGRDSSKLRSQPFQELSGFVFSLLLLLSFALWWHPLANTLTLALRSDEYTHILLILPISCVLIYLTPAELPAVPRKAVGIGSVLLALALLIAWFARFWANGWPEDVRLSLSMFALVTWWIASIIFCFGARTLQALLFPLCFLLFIVPLPGFALDEIVSFLQHQSAFAARLLFFVAGVPVTHDGILLSIPGLDIEVARECSSIRSSLMLVITTMVLGHLFLGSWWRKGLLILAAVPLAVLKNGFRIFTIAELGTRVDPGFFDGNLHHSGGIIFFAISLVVIAALLWGLRRTENLEGRRLRVATLK